MTEEQIHPAEYLAAIQALKAGLAEQETKAKKAVLDLAEQNGVERFKTPYGPVTVTAKKGAVYVEDPADFLEWVRERRPDEIVTTETVRPSYAKALVESLVVMRGEVYDPATGEPVEWADISAPGEPYTAWTATKEQKAAKEMARELFNERAGQALAQSLRQITDENR